MFTSSFKLALSIGSCQYEIQYHEASTKQQIQNVALTSQSATS